LAKHSLRLCSKVPTVNVPKGNKRECTSLQKTATSGRERGKIPTGTTSAAKQSLA